MIGMPFSKHPSVESTDLIDIVFDSTLKGEKDGAKLNANESEQNITPVRNPIKATKESLSTYKMRKNSDENSFLGQMNESHQSVSIEAFEALDAQIRAQTPKDYEQSLQKSNEISTQTIE